MKNKCIYKLLALILFIINSIHNLSLLYINFLSSIRIRCWVSLMIKKKITKILISLSLGISFNLLL